MTLEERIQNALELVKKDYEEALRVEEEAQSIGDDQLDFLATFMKTDAEMRFYELLDDKESLQKGGKEKYVRTK